jgi:hypothetical protein
MGALEALVQTLSLTGAKARFHVCASEGQGQAGDEMPLSLSNTGQSALGHSARCGRRRAPGLSVFKVDLKVIFRQPPSDQVFVDAIRSYMDQQAASGLVNSLYVETAGGEYSFTTLQRLKRLSRCPQPNVEWLKSS